jgi:hypothetical protein
MGAGQIWGKYPNLPSFLGRIHAAPIFSRRPLGVGPPLPSGLALAAPNQGCDKEKKVELVKAGPI